MASTIDGFARAPESFISSLHEKETIYAANPPRDPFHRGAGHEQGAASILIGIDANQSIARYEPVNIAEFLPLKPGAEKLSELS